MFRRFADQLCANPLLPSSALDGCPTSGNPMTADSFEQRPTFARTSGPVSLTATDRADTNVSNAAHSPGGRLSQMSPKDLSRMFDSLKELRDGTAPR